jgi:hypothetical protein
MILRSRLYERKPPDRDATLFIIYCEGSRREPQYFKYFKDISSRINLEVVEADSQGNNSPPGLYGHACSDIDGANSDSLLKYELGKGDQVWFVIDTDEWGDRIPELRSQCKARENWFVAQSNPCFEVWLYYHVFSEFAGNVELNGCAEWKNHVNAGIPGGFDSRKHPILIADAIGHAEAHFHSTANGVLYGSTEVFRLGKEIYPMVASVIEEARRQE